jgi:hypothetical protein
MDPGGAAAKLPDDRLSVTFQRVIVGVDHREGLTQLVRQMTE